MSLKRVIYLYIFILLTASCLQGQVVVRDSVVIQMDIKANESMNQLDKTANSGYWERSGYVTEYFSEDNHQYPCSWMSTSTITWEILEDSILNYSDYYTQFDGDNGGFTRTVPIAVIDFPEGGVFTIDILNDQTQSLNTTYLYIYYFWPGCYSVSEPCYRDASTPNHRSFCLISNLAAMTSDLLPPCDKFFLFYTYWGQLYSGSYAQPHTIKQNDSTYVIHWKCTESHDEEFSVRVMLNSKDKLRHFYIETDTSIIKHGEMTSLFIEPKDWNYEDIEIPDNTLLNIYLDEAGAKYGSLVATDGSTGDTLTNISYADAKVGKVKYVADGVQTIEPSYIEVGVMRKQDMEAGVNIKGSGFIIIMDSGDYFHITLNPNQIGTNEITTFFVQAKDENGINTIIPDNTPLIFYIMEDHNNGEQYGSLVGPDGTERKWLYGITYEEAKAGTIKYIADFDLEEGSKKVCISIVTYDESMIGIVCLKVKNEELDHFQITASQDTINYSDTTNFYIRGKDSLNNDIDPPDETLLTCRLDINSVKYGTLLGPNNSSSSVLEDITYADGKSGKVKFIANGEEPDSLEEVVLYVELKSDTSVKGIEKVVVKSKKVKLKIIKPSADVPQDTLWITNEPQMPIDTCKAVLLNYNDGEVNYEWKYSVEYEPPYEVPGIDFKHTYDDSSGAINADTTKYIKQFNSFIGGNIKIKVKALAPDSTYKDSVANSLILGENPEPEDARARISQLRSDIAIPLHCIMHWESSFKQFSGGYPLAGSPCDYGICQISYPESEEQIWDWHANLDRAIELYDEKVGSANRYVEQVRNGTDVYSDPINHPEWVRHLRPDGVDGFPNATNFTAEQLQTDIYQLYNGGHYYLWQPDDLENLDGPGQWIVNDVPNPSTGAARYQVHQNVVNGNPPW